MLEGCYRLETVVLPETVGVIGSRSFDNCQSLEVIELPPQLTEIGSYAFYQCAKLQTLVIPATVQAIGQVHLTRARILTRSCTGEAWRTD